MKIFISMIPKIRILVNRAVEFAKETANLTKQYGKIRFHSSTDKDLLEAAVRFGLEINH